jgi:hypothetical protein
METAQKPASQPAVRPGKQPGCATAYAAACFTGKKQIILTTTQSVSLPA